MGSSARSPGSLPAAAGEKPYPTLRTAAGGWRTAPPNPPPGQAARSTTSILRPTTRVHRARCCIRWHLRSPVADTEQPVPLLTPLQRGPSKNLPGWETLPSPRFALPFSASIISPPVVPTQALCLWGKISPSSNERVQLPWDRCVIDVLDHMLLSGGRECKLLLSPESPGYPPAAR